MSCSRGGTVVNEVGKVEVGGRTRTHRGSSTGRGIALLMAGNEDGKVVGVGSMQYWGIGETGNDVSAPNSIMGVS